jgi:deltex-like protein
MPTGTMKIRQDPTITCSGSDPGAIIIDYSLGCNVQKVYHPNPGTPHGSASRRAFLPDNTDGRNLLKRLKYAFQHGLTFCVGTSLTTGMPNVITWSSIHHKTRLARGPHGFPDLGYFINSNEELDALGVPAADNL